MDFNPIFDSFQKRHRSADVEIKPLTNSFRERVLLACAERFNLVQKYSYSAGPHKFWSLLHRILQYRVGRFILTDKRVKSPSEDTIKQTR